MCVWTSPGAREGGCDAGLYAGLGRDPEVVREAGEAASSEGRPLVGAAAAWLREDLRPTQS